MTCEHDWNTSSGLRLVVETGNDFMANIFPMAPVTFSVEYCRLCGSLRLPPDRVELLKAHDGRSAFTGGNL